MTYNFIYDPDFERLMWAIFLDNRASIPEIRNQIGFVIKDYVDSQVGLINENCIVYRIETDLGVISGFFVVEVNTSNKTGSLIMEQIRPAFSQYSSIISTQIVNFIQNNSFKPDFLF